MPSSERDIEKLLEHAKAGRPQALGELLQGYREQLLRIVNFRMDVRLRGRLDADDVVQDAYIEITQRFKEWAVDEDMPFFLWLRFIVVQKLAQMHRRHLRVRSRDVGREISIFSSPTPQATSAVLAAHLIGKQTSPSIAAMRSETTKRVESALNEMSTTDREILALRRFEQLKNDEVAKLLNISKKAASNRYIRALKRLHAEVSGNPNGEA